MNRINSVMFGGRTNNVKAADKKNKNHKRNVKIALAVGTAAVITGGIALYKNRNSKPVLKFRNFVKEGLLAPLKEKEVPLKKKVSNVWTNLKNGVKGLKKPKASPMVNKGGDVVEIKKPVKQPVAPKEETPANVLNNNKPTIEQMMHKPETKKPVEKVKPGRKDRLSQTKSAKLAKSNKADNVGEVDQKKNPIEKLGGSVVGAAKSHVKDLKAAAGAAAIVTGGAVAGGKISDAIQEKDKDFVITFNDEEFKGELKNGAAFDENGEPLSGTLNIDYGSGRKVLIKYLSGIMQQSVLYDSGDQTIPKTIRVYNGDGKIFEKHDELRLNESQKDGSAFISNITRAYYPDSILKAETEYFDKKGKNFKVAHYSRNVDEDGKIKGQPVYAYSTKTKTYLDGITLKSVFMPVNGEDKLIRISKRTKDNLVDITLLNLEGKKVSQLSSDENKQAFLYEHFVDGKNNGLIEIQDGKVVNVNDIGKDAPLVKLPGSGDNIERYMAKDESVVEITYDENGSIHSIASYADADEDSMPETEMLFDNGRAYLDVLYDKNGEIAFKVNH